MITLRELQEKFAQAVLGRDDTVLGQHVLATPHPVPLQG
jgi:hypothetical protein